MPNSISFWARSSEGSTVEAVRLGLDVFNPGERAAALLRLRRVAERFSAALGRPLPQPVADAILQPRPITVATPEMVIQLKPFRGNIVTWRLVFAAKEKGERALGDDWN